MDLMDYKFYCFNGIPQYCQVIKKHTFIKMKEMAEGLAEKMKFVRVDFYEINGKMYFGEITFYPASGFGALEPEDTDAWLGKLLRV